MLDDADTAGSSTGQVTRCVQTHITKALAGGIHTEYSVDPWYYMHIVLLSCVLFKTKTKKCFILLTSLALCCIVIETSQWGNLWDFQSYSMSHKLCLQFNSLLAFVVVWYLSTLHIHVFFTDYFTGANPWKCPSAGEATLKNTGKFVGLMQERRNSIANALELRLSCTNPWINHIHPQGTDYVTTTKQTIIKPGICFVGLKIYKLQFINLYGEVCFIS